MIGVNQQIKTNSGGGEGVGFAVPVDVARRSLDQLRDDGEVATPTSASPRSPLYPQLARALRPAGRRGRLAPGRPDGRPGRGGGPARRRRRATTFQARRYRDGGDVITRIDGRPVDEPGRPLARGLPARPGRQGDRRGVARRQAPRGRGDARRPAAAAAPRIRLTRGHPPPRYRPAACAPARRPRTQEPGRLHPHRRPAAVEEIRELAEPLQGQARRAPVGHRLRRRRLRRSSTRSSR